MVPQHGQSTNRVTIVCDLTSPTTTMPLIWQRDSTSNCKYLTIIQVDGDEGDKNYVILINKLPVCFIGIGYMAESEGQARREVQWALHQITPSSLQKNDIS